MYLRGTASLSGPEGARLFVLSELCPLRPAALLLAVLLPPAVALLPLLHDAVAAERHLRLSEAPTDVAPRLGSQNLVSDRNRLEFKDRNKGLHTDFLPTYWKFC